MYINHITLTTGHLARTTRADVAPEVTALIAPWLQAAIQSGRPVPLPAPALSHYSAHALVQDGALVVTFSAPLGPHTPGRPHAGPHMPIATMGVAQRSRHGAKLWDMLTRAFPVPAGVTMPTTPWLAVVLHPGMTAHAVPADWLADLERSIAWAWITRHPVIGAVD